MHILFSGGGTLGPVMPLLAVADAIKGKGGQVRLSWAGTKKGPEKAVVEMKGIEFHAIRSGKFRRYLSFRNLTDLFLILGGFIDSLRLLKRLQPDVVVSAGGFVAVPLIWAARIRKVRVHVHQQDFRPGLANKLSAPFAGSFSVSFEKSLADFRGRNAAWTGNPVRQELFSGSPEIARKRFGLESGIPVVLILGGGTGSEAINGYLRGSLGQITQIAEIIHLTGKGKALENADSWRYHQYELLTDDMKHAYQAADLIVTRAGMGTLTEISALGKPALVIPIPGSHQEENAAFFCDREGAVCATQEELDPIKFGGLIKGLVGDPSHLEALGQAAAALTKKDAAERVSELILGEKKGGNLDRDA